MEHGLPAGCAAEEEHGDSTDGRGAREAVLVLIELVREEKKELRNRVEQNMRIVVLPLVEELRRLGLSSAQQVVLDCLDFHIRHLVSCFGVSLSNQGGHLSAREIQVCALFRSGLDSREIANRLGLSPQTVIAHRKKIRKKLGLIGPGRNLASFIREDGMVSP
jgi:DNA-binding CsgD family transcriptional regulator